MTIRPATAADREVIVEMASHFIAATPYALVLEATPASLGAFVDAGLSLPDQFCIRVAVEDGQVFGFIAVADVMNLATGTSFSDEIAWWVEPGYRGALRAGPRLLAEVEAWATARGLPMAKMIAPWGSRVGRFYARHGYQPIETAWAKVLKARNAPKV